ncbi:outer membrane beta-barrel protein [Myxococcota bacterium]|nr:outer membrane beta-barrel protein [Myxococcota bacterium]MBU1537223.1 outer membrane beta-barrel protein [Myxococcota bacterium]
MRLIVVLLFSLIPSIVMAQNPFGNRGLFIKQGTFTVSGTVGAEYINYAPEGMDSSSGVILTFAPSAGYFINDNVSIQVSMAAYVPTGDLFDNVGTTWLIAAGAVYYHRINNFYVYAGLMAGYIKPGDTSREATNNLKNFGDLNGSLESNTTQTAIIFPAGLLFPITSSLAFDVGIRAVYIIDEDDSAIFDCSIGWFGLQAFF